MILKLRLALFCIILASAGTSKASPDQVVESFHQALLEAMQAGSIEGRKKIILNAVTKHFHTETIARISLGRNWRALEPQEQAGYVSLMQELIMSTYVSRFNTFNNQKFSVLTQAAITSNRTRVKSVLNTESETVNLDYQLINHKESWLIYDIVANGVSDLSLKRSNYVSLFTKGGLEAVRTDIRNTIIKNQDP